MRKVIISTLIAIIFLITLTSPILASEPEPNSVKLEDIEVFNSLLVDDDFLAVVPYYIPYTTPPSISIDKAFIFRVLSADGTTDLGSTLAYPYDNDGYGYGIVSFYIASGMTVGTAYIFRVQQNPVVYPTPQYWDFTIGDSNYCPATNNVTMQAALKAKIVTIAKSLSASYDVALLTKSESGATVLSGDGELYFLSAIPGLQSMCESLFAVQLENPDFTRRTWSYALANALKTKYAGTFFEEFMTGFAGLVLNVNNRGNELSYP